ncbi:hypothetical protein V8E36_008569 [Tilletia maclaganii]
MRPRPKVSGHRKIWLIIHCRCTNELLSSFRNTAICQRAMHESWSSRVQYERSEKKMSSISSHPAPGAPNSPRAFRHRVDVPVNDILVNHVPNFLNDVPELLCGAEPWSPAPDPLLEKRPNVLYKFQFGVIRGVRLRHNQKLLAGGLGDKSGSDRSPEAEAHHHQHQYDHAAAAAAAAGVGEVGGGDALAPPGIHNHAHPDQSDIVMHDDHAAGAENGIDASHHGIEALVAAQRSAAHATEAQINAAAAVAAAASAHTAGQEHDILDQDAKADDSAGGVGAGTSNASHLAPPPPPTAGGGVEAEDQQQHPHNDSTLYDDSLLLDHDQYHHHHHQQHTDR